MQQDNLVALVDAGLEPITTALQTSLPANSPRQFLNRPILLV